uniref:UDENN domain-containing protein n=1 Tax=Anabas testudineus TaxID=64144 RepID=A0A7N6AAA9_ANATE
MSAGGGVEDSGESEDVSVPNNIDLMAIPQLCFPGGLQVTNEQRDEQFHFLVFTDVFGNKTNGVVMQCYRPILEGTSVNHTGAGSSKFSKLFSAYSVCVISKYPYFTALKDCLSCLSIQLRTCCLSDMEEKVKEFAAKLTLVPIPPPGQLHVMFTLRPLTIVLPSQEDKDHPPIDLDLHLPFLCFRPQHLLQVISCLLQEQRVVLLSANWARLTLVAECLMHFIQPLSWQQPYVPVLSRGMLDFLMAPTAFLMGCHLSHFEEIASETDGLIIVNIDKGSVSTSCSKTFDLPDIPPAAADCFAQRYFVCQSLQIHFDLDQCHHASSSDINEQRTQRRAWQHNLNLDIQRVTLELIVNIFRFCVCHLNYEHRVFNSEEFLKQRKPTEKPFYKTVLETHIFHSFLKDRLNRKMDNFARMELNTRSEMQKPTHRPTMEIQACRRSSITERKMTKRLGISLPNLGEDQTISFQRHSLPTRIVTSEPGESRVKHVHVISIYVEYIQRHPPSSPLSLFVPYARARAESKDMKLLCRFYYLRGFINTLCSRRLDALSDFQNLYKTDTLIFPTQLVTWLVDSLHQDERQQADRRPELQRLILRVKTENEKPLVQQDDHVKKFVFPTQKLPQQEFVRCVQECGIVKDVATIRRLFEALADGDPKQVGHYLFRDFYKVWRETEAEAQDVNLPADVIHHLDNSECVYKLSTCVKTSHGVGKIAMTQKRLFLLTDGRPGYLEITKFRDIKDVKIASTPLPLVRIPSLRIQNFGRAEVFEANLKAETELWSLMVKEMWGGRKMADQHKDPQYMTQALKNVLLMDAVTRCLQAQRSITAVSKLAYFDRIRHEGLTLHKTTSETLKHKINPSLDLAEPQTVHVLLYTPGTGCKGEMNPKLWVALSGGKVVVFDAASWSMLQGSIQVGSSQLNCMLGMVQEQVWIGSQDSVIYIIDIQSMSCNKQLTEHRHEVTGLTVNTGDQQNSQQAYSCSSDGAILQWDSASLEVKRQFYFKCDRLSSIQIHDGALWCCKYTVHLKSSFYMCLFQLGQLWMGCAKSGELCVWQTNNHYHPHKRISLPGSAGVSCMIRVKNQVLVGGHCDGGLKGQVLVLDPESHTVTKELQAHSDTIQALCSAEDRYVLSGSAYRDGKIAIWKVE